MEFWWQAVLVAIGILTSLVYYYTQHLSDTTKATVKDAESVSESVLAVRDELLTAVPHAVLDRNDSAFRASIQAMWAGPARDPVPALIVVPRNTTELSVVVKILQQAILTSKTKGCNGIEFAIRSGGHSPVPGAASIGGGVVLDLSLLNSIDVDLGKNVVTVGSGARWKDVYSKLDVLGLACAGGRDGGVGVGGFLLGGGLSFFSSRVGFACDQVIRYEVVLADGKVVNATSDEHQDLAKALRGGGNNFGIVTKFTMQTFPQGKVWAGYVYYRPSSAPSLVKGYYGMFTSKTYRDERANCILALVFVQNLGLIMPVAGICHTGSIAHPSALDWALGPKKLYSDLKIRTLTDMTELTASKSRSYARHRFQTTTFVHSFEMLDFVRSHLESIKGDMKKINGLLYSISFQPVVPTATRFSNMNIVGISTQETLTVLLISSYWSLSSDDTLVASMGDRFIASIEAKAREMNVYYPYKYNNYCALSQDPYAEIGEETREFLWEVSNRYDPSGIFRKSGVPGGFKINFSEAT